MIKNDLQVAFRSKPTAGKGVSLETVSLFHRQEKVLGKVLRSDTPGTALVSIKGQKLNVYTQVPLKQGAQITLLVKSLGPRPTLQLISETAPQLQASNLLEHDLKALLAKLMGPGTEGSSHLQKLQSVIEKIQLLSREGLEQGGKIYIPLPVQLSDGFFSVAELLLQLPSWEEAQREGGKPVDEAFRATLLLNMSRLGPVRAEFVLRGETIEGMFLVAEHKTKEILEKSLYLLMDALADRGFMLQQVGCFVRDPETVTQSLLQEIIPEAENSIYLVG